MCTYLTTGESPYEQIRGKDIRAHVKHGNRLPKPEQCDDKYVHFII